VYAGLNNQTLSLGSVFANFGNGTEEEMAAPAPAAAPDMVVPIAAGVGAIIAIALVVGCVVMFKRRNRVKAQVTPHEVDDIDIKVIEVASNAETQPVDVLPTASVSSRRKLGSPPSQSGGLPHKQYTQRSFGHVTVEETS
jgi:hypothetical protein